MPLNSDRDDLLLDLALMDKGVTVVTRMSVNRANGTVKRAADIVKEKLSTLSASDRRITRRKFRKLVRRAKKNLHNMRSLSSRETKRRIEKMDETMTLEDGSQRLTKKAIEARNLEVQLHFKRMQLEGKI